jgi:phage tail-like protein
VPALNSQSSVKLQSSYLEYLPALFRDDEFMGQFLLIFESIMKPLENTVDNLSLYFGPLMTPEPLLPWLASWVDLTLDPTWPIERRRELVRSAAELYRWRGTKRGLTEYLRIYTGRLPEISEYIPGMTLAHETRLGINTQLGSSGAGYHFTVTLELDGNSEIDTNTVRAIIDAQKPAHTVYTLQIRQGEPPKQQDK